MTEKATTSYFKKHIKVCEQYVALGMLGRSELARVISGSDLSNVHTTVLKNILIFLGNLALLMHCDDCDVTEASKYIIAVQEEIKARDNPPSSRDT